MPFTITPFFCLSRLHSLFFYIFSQIRYSGPSLCGNMDLLRRIRQTVLPAAGTGSLHHKIRSSANSHDPDIMILSCRKNVVLILITIQLFFSTSSLIVSPHGHAFSVPTEVRTGPSGGILIAKTPHTPSSKQEILRSKSKKINFSSNLRLQFVKTVTYYFTSSEHSSVVEHHVANVMVVGSSPIARSIFLSSCRNICSGFFVSVEVFL